MAHPISRLVTGLLCAAAVFVATPQVEAERTNCNAPALECERQIRRMLGGRRHFGVMVEERDGLVVKLVQPNSPAMRAGLIAGDRLIGLNGKSLVNKSPREFKQIIADARDPGRLYIIIERGGLHRKLEGRLEPLSREQVARIIAAHLAQSHPATANKQ